MRVGEISDFVIEPDYGYGESGSGSSIPPNSTLNLFVLFIYFLLFF
jgi:FKBP-type peptidyl-prolyl cis-trans isomerase